MTFEGNFGWKNQPWRGGANLNCGSGTHDYESCRSDRYPMKSRPLTPAKPSLEKGGIRHTAEQQSLLTLLTFDMVTTFARTPAASNSPSSPEVKSRKGGASHGWQIKRRKQRSEETQNSVPELGDNECDLFDAEVVVCRDTRWAVLWLRRLQPRKRFGKVTQLKLEGGRETPKVMTLAEQLHQAQEIPLSLPDSKVLSACSLAHV